MEALLPDTVVRDPVRVEPSGNSFDMCAPAARQVCVVEGLSGLAKQELAPLKERAEQLRYHGLRRRSETGAKGCTPLFAPVKFSWYLEQRPNGRTNNC